MILKALENLPTSCQLLVKALPVQIKMMMMMMMMMTMTAKGEQLISQITFDATFFSFMSNNLKILTFFLFCSSLGEFDYDAAEAAPDTHTTNVPLTNKKHHQTNKVIITCNSRIIFFGIMLN